MIRRRNLAGLALPPALTRGAAAQAPAWPNRTVRFIVPFAAGSPIEIPARFLAEHLAPRLGQPVVVESRPGAGGAVGTIAVAQANDGHTFLVGSGSLAIQPALQPDIGYDPLRDLQAVSLLTESPMVFAVRPGHRFRDLAGLVATAQREPGRVTFGHSGNGTTTHMLGALFGLRAAIEWTAVPYRGSGQLTGAFLSGDVEVMIGESSTLLPLAREGRILLLGQSGAQRSPAMADVPTMEEVVPGTTLPIWFAMTTGRATPPEAILRMVREMAPARAPDSPLSRRFTNTGGHVILSEPGVLEERIRRELALWREVVRQTGIRAE